MPRSGGYVKRRPEANWRRNPAMDLTAILW